MSGDFNHHDEERRELNAEITGIAEYAEEREKQKIFFSVLSAPSLISALKSFLTFLMSC
jgi:hypothetical protein